MRPTAHARRLSSRGSVSAVLRLPILTPPKSAGGGFRHCDALRKYSVFNATQSIEHALRGDVSIKQAQRRIAAKRCIR